MTKKDKESEDADPLETSSLMERIAKKSPEAAKALGQKKKNGGITKFLTSTKTKKEDKEDAFELEDSDFDGETAPTKKTTDMRRHCHGVGGGCRKRLSKGGAGELV